MTISLVVPVFNEEEAIPKFLNEIEQELADYKLEIIFVDDGSTDNTLDIIKQSAQADERIKFVSFTRNFGKEAALTAGLEHASGDAVIPMDVDLQDPPSLIHEFVRLWREGYKTVYGVRRSRNEDTAGKRTSAGLFYKAFNRLSSTSIPYNAGDYRLMDRCVVEVIRSLPERTRFMKGIFAWPGYSSIGVDYDRPSRSAGETKFNFWKLWNFAIDGLTSFSTWPIRIWSYVGLTVAALAFALGIWMIIDKLIWGNPVAGYSSIMVSILFLGGIQLIGIGVLGEYIGRIYTETKRRPTYIKSEEG